MKKKQKRIFNPGFKCHGSTLFFVVLLWIITSCNKDEFIEPKGLYDQELQKKSAPVDGRTFSIQNFNSGLFLAIENASTSTGASVVQSNESNDNSQHWVTEESDFTDYFYIKNAKSGKYLSVASRSTENRANIIQWTLGSTPSQQWEFTDRGNSLYSIKNRNSNKVLDVEGRSTADGANVQQWNYSGGENQRWTLTAVGVQPCAFDLASVSENSTVLIDCLYDLEEADLTLPAGVTLTYGEGGTITNGTLTGTNLKIDGRLLNSTLAIEGNAFLLDPIFSFEKSKWNIVEGVTSDEIALRNRDNINKAIKLVKSLEGTTFEIDQLDAYFDVRAGFGGNKVENYRRSIQLPSDFHLKMSDNTHLRVQPNDKQDYALLCTWSTNNTKISGGHLWGDRYTHDYKGGDTGPQDLGYGIYYLGVIDGVVDGTSANEFTGDGFIISSLIRRNADGSENQNSYLGKINFSKNVIVKNCTFDKNRRNGLALTDVEGALIEKCTFSNTGNGGEYSISQEGYSSKGVIPRYGIDLEAIQYFEDDDITLQITEIVTDVDIKNCIFINNYRGDIDVYKAWDVEIFNNNFTSNVTNVASYNISIYDNVFNFNGGGNPNVPSRAIDVGPRVRKDGSYFSRGWEIYNNTIEGYDEAIKIGGENQKVYNNTLKDFKNGIMLLGGNNVELTNNNLTSAKTNSIGYLNFPLGIILSNSTIKGGSVNVSTFPLLIQKMNQNSNSSTNQVTYDDIEFHSINRFKVDVRNSKNLTIRNSEYYGVKNSTSPDIQLINNTIIPID